MTSIAHLELYKLFLVELGSKRHRQRMIATVAAPARGVEGADPAAKRVGAIASC